MNNLAEFSTVNPKSQDIAVKDVINMITNGYKVQNLEDTFGLDDELRLELTDSIILAPDYQRDYRASVIDESSIIESVLLGIPIPPVFLANNRIKGIQVLNVVDGQHRLRAFYRFKENSYCLTGLKLLESLNGKRFSDLEFSFKEKILSHKLAAIVFIDFPGIDFELEIFNRYNKGTKPLTQQEIRHAVYNSNLNSYVNDFAKELVERKTTSQLFNAYNATKDRYQKKKVQESIFVIMNILENGINESYYQSSSYAEEYMKQKSLLEKESPSRAHTNFNLIKERFEEFNEIIEFIGNDIEFPFSREIYGISSRSYKFQISIAMILSGIINKLLVSGYSLTELKSQTVMEKFINYMSDVLRNSYLEDPEYNASSTNAKKVKELVDMFEFSKIFS
ncbi:DUF262 domain-containing protein [Paenibacillus sp. FSL K6-1230]|uniref:DUF262 domain-containing protein n=1 Tax=Paenibacillus sp. FSL K6-1230 TaxID=2921603 RepID=UPI0030F9BBCF